MKIGSALARQQARGPEGPAGFFIAFVVCVALSLIAWLPLSLPPRLLHSFLSQVSRGALDVGLGCGPSPTSASYLCSLEAGVLAILPAVLFSLVLFLLRKQLTQGLRVLLGPRLPQNARFLLAPAIATLGFTLSWGYVHAATPYRFGLVPQVLFPALVGLFTFGTAQYGMSIAQSVPRLFDARDKLPMWARLGAAIVVPTVVSIALMSQRPVTFIDLKQQLIVLVSLAIGFAALAPRRNALRAKDTVANDATGSSRMGGAK